VTTGYFTMKANRKVLCLACLEQRPATPFGQRLKAFRLAAGMTLHELTERSGVNRHRIHRLESRAAQAPPAR
jgi:Helix-turn-helix domain